jgi:general secretion pathway protein J
MARPRPFRVDAGFTLIEMLVALALTGLAAGLMLEGLGSGQRLWSGEAARTAGGESVAAAQAILRARLEQMRPLTRYSADLPYADFDGAGDTLVFLAPPAERAWPAAARRYRLALSDRGDLVLGSAAPLIDADGEAPYTDQLLLHGVGGLHISYYGSDARGGPPAWRADWIQRASPPQAVRIRLSLKNGDRRVWPDLIVRPGAEVDSLCAIDAATGACRGRS